MVSSAIVDIKEIKRQVRIQLLGDLMPIFESQGLPVSDIGAVGNKKRV
jgi:hydrogenase maturation factor